MRVFGKINIIGLDNGYGNIKTANGIFPASVTRCEAEPAHAQDVLVYDGKYYVIGAGHRAGVVVQSADHGGCSSGGWTAADVGRRPA